MNILYRIKDEIRPKNKLLSLLHEKKYDTTIFLIS